MIDGGPIRVAGEPRVEIDEARDDIVVRDTVELLEVKEKMLRFDPSNNNDTVSWLPARRSGPRHLWHTQSGVPVGGGR
jgi:hypothetical protein